VRRFEYIGGGSEKFWEIDRVGASVTVRFGRIGTAGQTQVKDLGSDPAAGAHVAKLIAEKVKKGYVEGGSAPAVAPAARLAPPPPAVEQRTPSPETREDAWKVPPAWWRGAQPFRGRSPARPAALDRASAHIVADLRARAARFEQVLDHPSSDPDLVDLARLHLTAAGDSPPLGAAVAGAVLASTTDWGLIERLPAVVDEWVNNRGPVFAAEAAALLGAIRVVNPINRPSRGANEAILRAALDDQGSLWQPYLRRARTLLAAATDADYGAATARLAGLRDGRLGVHLAAAYLLPTEQDWVDQDIAGFGSTASSGSLRILSASVTTAAQAWAIVDAAGARSVGHHGSLYNMAAKIGPDVAPVLARIFDGDIDSDTKRRIAAMLGEIPTDTAFGILLDRLAEKHISPVVMEAMARSPRRAMRMLAVAASGSGPQGTTARKLLRDHAASNPGLAEEVRHDLAGAAGLALDGVLAGAGGEPDAPAGELPSILVTPPWTNRRGRPAPVVVAGLTSESPVTLRWKPGEREAWAAADIGYAWMLGQIGDWGAAVRRAAAGGDWRQVAIFALGPEEVVRPVLSHAELSHSYDAAPALRRVLGRFGNDAIAYVFRAVLTTPTSLAGVLAPFEGSEVTQRMADWYVRSKSIRPVAMSWFDRHAAAAADDLVAAALGRPGKERTNAEKVLRFLDQRGHRQAVRAAAAELGPGAGDGIDAMLALDPLEMLPARIPALPAWLDPAHLPQVLLRDRRSALPAAAVGHLCTMLTMSKPGDTYAGVEIVRDAVDPPSAAEMVWGIFERWQSAGYPAKEAWVLDALALLGDDETVRRLAPLIRAWPGEAAHKRAVTGLDVLSAIGTDVALMHLHGIAEKAKFAGLKSAARAKMEEVAEALGLTAEQLADRLVPDFGLDADGSMILDYGERRFRVGFDEQLKPVVADEDGSRRKLLPKPGAKDDPALAPAAYARFAGLKKDVKTVAADQIRRFERAMVNGRRWTAEEQRTLFVDHPLLRHLTRRLVWATFDGDDRPTGSFRVAEDQTLADSSDDELTVAGDTVVGIAHPLHLGETLGAWSDVFADYEILQPFPQLGREVLALTAEERAARLLRRFAGAKVYTGKILGLSHRGWQRGSPQDAGVSNLTYKPVRDGRAVVVDLDPGIIAGDAMEWPEQTIAGVWLNDGPADYGNSKGNFPFGVLDDITASEMLRDIEGLLS
jgi:predicted DNA-binding WGR domain protein